jgi:Tol biopolymer transport system component
MDRDGTCGVWETRTPSSDGQLLFFDLHSGVRRPLTKDDGRVYSHAILSPDGAMAAFRILEPGVQPIYLQSTAGGEPRKICPNCGTPADWTADGKHVLYVTGGQPAIIGLLEVETGKYRDMIHHPNYSLYGPRARLDSRGDGWVALYADNSARSRQIFLVPVKGFQPGPQRDWVPLTDGTGWDQSPAWSEDGKTIYYVVRHGGYSCIMAKQIGGPSWEVRHFHSPRQTLMRSVSNRGADSLWVAGGRLYFTLDDRTSDIWRLSR